MRKSRIVISMLVSLLLMLGLALPVAAQVEPAIVEKALQPGASIEVTKTVTTPAIPPLVDIFLLEDETGSFMDDIATLQVLAPAIWDAIAASGADFTMGVAGFRDFAQDGWGLPGDWVYKRYQDLTSVKTDFQTGVNALTAVPGAGADGPEAQLEALHYLAVPGHAAIDSDGDGVMDPEDTPMGQQPTWRTGAQRVVLLATDASCHVTGDPPLPGWPGDAGTISAAVTAGILSGAGIVVIGLTPGGAGTIGCVDTLAAGTGGSVHATTATGETIKEAILAGLAELTTDVWWEVEADPGLTVTFDRKVERSVPGSTTVTFTETITVDRDATQCTILKATVIFYANSYPEEGEEIGRQAIRIKVKDIVPPTVSCVETVNPHGKNVPGGKALGKGKGVNPDGFYQLLAKDNCLPPPEIWVGTACNAMLFGPFPSGTIVKFTEAPGATPSMKKMGSTKGQAGAVIWHITLPSDPVIKAVDAAGHGSDCVGCLVPPPPK